MKPYARDLKIAAQVGFVAGVLAVVPATLFFPYDKVLVGIVAIAIIFSASVLGLVTGIFFSRWVASLVEVAKFAIVGGLSTLIELSILNVLFVATGITSGIYYSIFKGFTFLVALFNSYFFNKFWTFGPGGDQAHIEFAKFFISNMIGLLINVSTASLVVNAIGAPARVDPALWANLGAIIAVIVTMIWNFLAYKYVVFKKV